MEYRDYYKILGLKRDATQEEIKRTYRKLARKYHPDVSKEKDAEAKFKEVQEANSVLSDPEKRAAYDQLGQRRPGEQFRPPPDWGRNFEFRTGSGGEEADFSDFFANLFGGGSPFGRAGGQRSGGAPFGGRGFAPAEGRDHHARIDLPLEEAYRGGTRTLQLQRPQVTSDGRVETRNHELRVNIPAGVTHGQQIRLAGQGEPSPDGRGRPGDLYLEVNIPPHPQYQLDGRDVTLTLPVAPWEAALGATVQVPTLGGPVDLRIPPGARAGQRMRLKGRGLPGKHPGDQYVNLKIVLPPANDERAKALYEQMKREMNFDPRADLQQEPQ